MKLNIDWQVCNNFSKTTSNIYDSSLTAHWSGVAFGVNSPQIDEMNMFGSKEEYWLDENAPIDNVICRLAIKLIFRECLIDDCINRVDIK